MFPFSIIIMAIYMYYIIIGFISCICNSSSGYEDELCWAANWLFRATGNATYMTYAEQYYSDGLIWAFGWDNKYPGAQVRFKTMELN